MSFDVMCTCENQRHVRLQRAVQHSNTEGYLTDISSYSPHNLKNSAAMQFGIISMVI